MPTLTVNGQSKQVDVDNDTPLLWVDAVEKVCSFWFVIGF